MAEEALEQARKRQADREEQAAWRCVDEAWQVWARSWGPWCLRLERCPDAELLPGQQMLWLVVLSKQQTVIDHVQIGLDSKDAAMSELLSLADRWCLEALRELLELSWEITKSIHGVKSTA